MPETLYHADRDDIRAAATRIYDELRAYYVNTEGEDRIVGLCGAAACDLAVPVPDARPVDGIYLYDGAYILTPTRGPHHQPYQIGPNSRSLRSRAYTREELLAYDWETDPDGIHDIASTEHSWNVLPDGSIVDITVEQFDGPEGPAFVAPDDPRQDRYVPVPAYHRS